MKNGLSRRSFLKGMGFGAAALAAGGFGFSGLTKALALPSRRQDLPRLVYVFPGSAQPDQQRVQDALSEYMAERIGATIELRPIEWGAFNDQIGLMNASGENYDLAFTAPWINNYYTNVNQEYLAPLDELFAANAPNYWASLTPETWEAARVSGNIYAGINQQIFVKPFGPYARTDVLEAIGMKDQFLAVTSYEDLDPIFAAIKEYAETDETLQYVTYNLSPINVAENWGYDPQDAMLVVKSDDESAQVRIYAETDEYRQAAELIRRYYLAGYVPADIPTFDEIDQAFTAGLYAVRVSEIVKPGGEAEASARWGFPLTAVAIAEPLLTTGGVTATLTGVSSLSENPDLAVKFLELVNTDPVFYNMLAKGLEGVHWEWADEENRLIKPAGDAASFGDTGYAPNADWMFGNVFNSYYTDPSQIGAWEETAELNRTARPSPVLGFTFDRSAVETEIASISAVQTEFAEPLGSGVVDVDEGLPRLIQALKDAGIERVRDEMQSQIDAWKAENA
jgi:putative aldouronate transport system substrate-binding protein